MQRHRRPIAAAPTTANSLASSQRSRRKTQCFGLRLLLAACIHERLLHRTCRPLDTSSSVALCVVPLWSTREVLKTRE